MINLSKISKILTFANFKSKIDSIMAFIIFNIYT